MYHKLQKNAVLQHILNYVLQTISYQLRTKILIFATFLLIFSFAAKADWSTDITNNTPVCTLSGDQWLQDTKSDGNGGVWVTWIDDENRKIAVQHYNSNGDATFGATGHYITSTG